MGRACWGLVAEVAQTGADHDEGAFVGGVDDFLVAQGAAGLDDAARAGIGHHVEAVSEGKKCVAGDGGALQGELGVGGFDGGDAGGVQAAHLACAYA